MVSICGPWALVLWVVQCALLSIFADVAPCLHTSRGVILEEALTRSPSRRYYLRSEPMHRDLLEQAAAIGMVWEEVPQEVPC